MDSETLNRITQYTNVAHTILDMYNKQVHCAKSILHHEQKAGKNFSLIINTREDASFFQPMNLTTQYDQYIVKEKCGVVAKIAYRGAV